MSRKRNALVEICREQGATLAGWGPPEAGLTLRGSPLTPHTLQYEGHQVFNPWEIMKPGG